MRTVFSQFFVLKARQKWGSVDFHVSSFFVFVVGLCGLCGVSMFLLSLYLLLASVLERERQNLFSDRKMNCGEKKPQLYGEIHDAVILSDVLFVVDVVGTNLILGLWDAWCF
jgi:hypothetical protein